MVSAAGDTERLLDLDSDRDPPSGVSWFEVVRGNVPIILSAPHATRVYRENAWRFGDGGGTAALALGLQSLSGVYVVHTTFRSPSDPNYYDDNDYKRALAQLMKESRARLVLDIHGSDELRPYDIDLGTMDGASLLGQTKLVDDLVATLRANGIEALSSNFFAASKNQTVTRFAAAHQVPAM
jgi:hypothetical protein